MRTSITILSCRNLKYWWRTLSVQIYPMYCQVPILNEIMNSATSIMVINMPYQNPQLFIYPATTWVQTQNNSSNNPAPPESKWCNWAKGSFSHTGHDTPHQEQCFSFGMRMVTCQHIGCSTKVHPPCHIDWLKRHCYERPPQHFCRQHSNCYQL